jgi:NAD(P)-dependent dehydrogenase (short-subunit alcohol dehydrogenase family)
VNRQALEGRVALVTGGGRGIGREHALTLARLGASVMVNDLGGKLDGGGSDASIARAVVDEIVAGGGVAAADTASVASVHGGRAIVAHTVEQFGRIDIVVNNAGFASGGGTVALPVVAEIDALLAVHLHGALGTMSAGFADMRLRGSGRIVNTVSEAALDARFVGALGYGVAKAALWSATLVAATEGAPYGVTVNAVSPGARTRMSAPALDATFRDGASSGLDLHPHHVADVVACLVLDEAADITGRIIHAAGGEVREYETRRTSRSDVASRLQSAARERQGA